MQTGGDDTVQEATGQTYPPSHQNQENKLKDSYAYLARSHLELQ